MKSTDLPRHPNGSIAWAKFFAKAQPGDVFRLEGETPRETGILRGNASKALREIGRPHISRILGCTVTLTCTTGPAPTRLNRNAEARYQEIRNAEARCANLPARIAEAEQNVTYWKRQIALRLLPEAREQASAAHAAWKMTTKRLKALTHA